MQKTSLVFLVIGFVVTAGPLYGANEITDDMQSVTGVVADMDYMNSRMTVSVEGVSGEVAKALKFWMPIDIPVTRGTESIDASEIDEGDTVTVGYKRDPETGNLIAQRIQDIPRDW